MIDFRDIFSQMLFSKYIVHIEKYTDEKVIVLKSKDLPKNKVVIQTKVVNDDIVIPIDYSMHDTKAGWRVYDVRVEGISLVMNYRSQFMEILRKKDAQHLIDKLKKKVQKDAKKS